MRWLSWLRRPLSLIVAPSSRGQATTRIQSSTQHGVAAAAAFTPSPLRAAARPCSASSSSSSSGDSFVTARSRAAATAGAAREDAEEAFFSPNPSPARRRRRRQQQHRASAAATATATDAVEEEASPPSTSTTTTTTTSSRRQQPPRTAKRRTSGTNSAGGGVAAVARPCSTVVVLSSSGSGSEDENENDETESAERAQEPTKAARRTLSFPVTDQEPLSTLPLLATALPAPMTTTTTRGRKKQGSGIKATAAPPQLPPPPPALPNLSSLVLTPVRGGRTADGGPDPYSLPPSPSASLLAARDEDGNGKTARGGCNDVAAVVEVGGESGSGEEGEEGEEDAGSSQILLSSDDSEGEDSEQQQGSESSDWRPRARRGRRGKENAASDDDDDDSCGESDESAESDESDSSLPSTHSALAAPAPPKSAAAFRRVRAARAAELYSKFNERAFGNRLPPNVSVLWSARLRTTAGLTHFTRLKNSNPKKATAADAAPSASVAADPKGLYVEGRGARIELSTKVIDSEGRLAATLLHEMCHVAAWTLDAQAKPPHGPRFQLWAERAARALPGVPSVRTCHSYRVHAPHTWRCAGGSGGATSDPVLGRGCGQVYRRHSRSIDVARHACGSCRGRLVYEGRLGPDGRLLGGGGGGGAAAGGGGAAAGGGGAAAGGGGAAAGGGGAAAGGGRGALRQQQQQNGPTPTPNAFAAFVAERFARVKGQAPRGASHGEVMRRLAAEWRVEKEARRARAAAG